MFEVDLMTKDVSWPRAKVIGVPVDDWRENVMALPPTNGFPFESPTYTVDWVVEEDSRSSPPASPR